MNLAPPPKAQINQSEISGSHLSQFIYLFIYMFLVMATKNARVTAYATTHSEIHSAHAIYLFLPFLSGISAPHTHKKKQKKEADLCLSSLPCANIGTSCFATPPTPGWAAGRRACNQSSQKATGRNASQEKRKMRRQLVLRLRVSAAKL